MTRRLPTILTTLMAATLLPLAVPAAHATTAPPKTVLTTTQPTLRLGSTGASVVSLQQRLTALGYLDVGPVDGVFGQMTLHAVIAFQKVVGIARDGVVGPITWSKLAAPYRPGPRYPMSTPSLEVVLGKQVVYFVRSGAVRYIVDASTGSGSWYYQNGSWHQAITPVGRFRIYSRYNAWQNSPLGWMYRPNYFYQGYAIHGSTSVPTYPASHGCVRVTVPTMDRLWGILYIGMPVAIY